MKHRLVEAKLSPELRCHHGVRVDAQHDRYGVTWNGAGHSISEKGDAQQDGHNRQKTPGDKAKHAPEPT